MKILTKLTLAFLLVSLVPLTGTSIVTYLSIRKTLTQNILNQLDSVATIQERRLEELIDQNLEKLALVSSRTQLRQGLGSFIRDTNRGAPIRQVVSPESTLREQGRMNQTLIEAKFSVSSFKEISVLTLDGKVVASTDTSRIGTKHSREDFFIKGKQGNNIGDFFFNRNQNIRVHLSGPIYSNNKLLGVALVDLDPNSITSIVKDYSGLGETGETTLGQRTKSGDGVATSPLRFDPHAALRVPVPKTSLKRPMTQALLRNEQFFPDSVNYRGRSALAVSRYLPKVDWGLTVIIDRAEAFAPIYELQNSLLLTIFTSSTGVILISVYVARSLTKPVISLTQAASKISSGDLLQRANVISNDETGSLAQTFNQMADSLLEARTGLEQKVEARTAQLQEEITERTKIAEELRESKLFAESVTEQSTSIIYVLDLDAMTNVYSNRSVAQLIGYSLEQTQAMGKDFLPNVIHPDDLLDRLYRFELFKFAKDGEVIEFEQRVKHASGEWRWIWSREAVFKRRLDGTAYQIIGTAQDITERKQIEVELKQARDQLEKRVAERTAELQTAIATLEIEITERKQAEDEIRLLQEIGQAVSESSDFHAALGVALRKVCEVTGWNYGEAWIPCSDDTALEYGPAWYGSENSLEQFRQFSETFTFTPGVGLPGRVWSSKQPEWIQDVSTQPESIFLRAGIAMATGLKAALGTPVIANDRVLAVLAFFMSKPYEEDERLVRVISTIATQLGSVIQRKQAEESLEASERQLRMVTDHTPVLIAYCDTEQRYQFVNQGYAERFGLTREEVIGKHIPEVVGEEAYSSFRQQVDAVLSGQSVEFEVEVPYQGIGHHYMHVAYVPEFDPQGEVRGLIAAISDITRRKRVEMKLSESERRFRFLAESMPQIIWTARPDGWLDYYNQRWYDYTGMTFEQTQGWGWGPVLHPDDLPKCMDAWTHSFRTGEPYVIEYRFKRASDGMYRWHLGRALPRRDDTEAIVQWVGTYTDIHDQKELETQLRTFQGELEVRVQERTAELAVANEGLGVEIKERQQVEEELKHRIQFEQLITTLSTHFISLALDEIDSSINSALQTVGEFANADRSYIFLFTDTLKTVANNTHEWCADATKPQIQNLQGIPVDDELPWFSKKIKRLEVVHIPAVAELPPEASTEKAHFEVQNIQSLIVVPIAYGRSLLGFVGFDFVQAAKDWSSDDITLLKVFGEMLANALERKRVEQDLTKATQLLESVLNDIGDGVIVADKAGEFLLFNPAAEQILGTDSTTKTPDKWSQEYGLYLPDRVTPYPAEDLPLALAIRGVVANEIEVFSRSQQRPTGVWLSASARPLKNPDGGITGGIAVFHDITERKRAEEDLQTYAAKLEKANQELEQFNYVAAHDLKTPLRTISTRTDLLTKQLGPLSQNAQHQLSRILLATLRMDSLLNDLVAYSRIGTRVSSPVPIDSQVIVKQVLHQQLKQPIQESGATIEVEGTLPTVLADATQFAQVWQHLISNSLKFCRITPQIKVSATCSSEDCTFCVEDNGIGIPVASQQRIFGVFKRLHSQEVYEGTGIGLAVVKRVLDWHGGRIWVESEDGKGSRFFFTLRRANHPNKEVRATD